MFREAIFDISLRIAESTYCLILAYLFFTLIFISYQKPVALNMITALRASYNSWL